MLLRAMTLGSFAILLWLAISVTTGSTGLTSPASADGPLQWQQVSFPQAGPSVSAFASDPSNPDVLWTGYDEGYFSRSEDGGATWTSTSTGLDRSCFYRDPAVYADGLHIAAICLDAGTATGLYLTSDGGLRWRQTLAGKDLRQVLYAPTNPQIIWASVSNGDGSYAVMRSTDGGSTWQAADGGLPSISSFFAMSPHPTDPSTLFISYYNQFSTTLGVAPVWRTDNAGASWQAQSTKGIPNAGGNDYPCIYSIMVNPLTPTTLLAVAAMPGAVCMQSGPGQTVSQAVYRSMDGGSSWDSTPVISGFWSTQLTVDPSNSQTYYVPKTDGVYRSTDAGATWQKMGDTPTQLQVLVVDGTDPLSLYGFDDQLFSEYVSHDRGQTWITGTVPYNALAYRSVASLPSVGGIVATGDEVYRTTDGVSWLALDRTLPHSSTTSLAPAPSQPTTLYAGMGGFLSYLVWRSDDSGRNWTPASGGLPSMAGCPLRPLAAPYLTVDPNDSQVVYVAADQCSDYFHYTVYRSGDSGASWTAVSSGLPSSISQLAHDGQAVYASSQNGLYKSLNGGATWLNITPSATGVYSDVRGLAISGTTIYAAANVVDSHGNPVSAGILRSADGGSSWQTGTLPGTLPSGLKFGKLVATPSALFATWFQLVNSTVASQGILRSVDGGVSWQEFAVPDCARLTDATNDGGVFVSLTGVGLIRSDNGGSTWRPQVKGLAHVSLDTGMAANGDEVLVGASESTVFKSSDAGQTWQLIVVEQQTQHTMCSDAVREHMAINPNNPNFMYFAQYGFYNGYGFFRSTDGGATWTKILQGYIISDMEFSRDDANEIWLAAGFDGALYSANNGDSWQSIESQYSPIYHIAVNPYDPSIILAASTGGGGYLCVIRTTDGGATWAGVASPCGWAATTGVAFNPFKRGVAYAGNLVSSDDGLTWKPSSSSYWPDAFGPTQTLRVYSLYGSALARSTDGAQTWTALNWPESSVTTTAVGWADTPRIYAYHCTQTGCRFYKALDSLVQTYRTYLPDVVKGYSP